MKSEEAKAETYRSQYPGSLHFDFTWDEKKGKELGLQQIWHDDKFSYAQVVAIDPKENLLTVQKLDGAQVTYDPSRLRGISAYREIQREFAVGDRLQFTAPNKELGVANRDLAAIEKIDDGHFAVRMDDGKTVSFDANQMRHFDHGYAVTSHSSQGLTAERVLVNIDTNVHPDLINTRLAYVSVSRASHDAQIYTNDAAALVRGLSHDVTKTSVLEMRPVPSVSQEIGIAM